MIVAVMGHFALWNRRLYVQTQSPALAELEALQRHANIANSTSLKIEMRPKRANFKSAAEYLNAMLRTSQL